MSQFAWEGIFSILNVLVPGIILALFAAYYQNRRKREIKVEGKIAIDRIDGYERMLSMYYDAQELQDVTTEEEKKAEAVFGYLDVEVYHCQYPRALKNEEDFEGFYERLTTLQREYQIYLDDRVSRQLNRSLAVYTHIKKWMDAFCDTEHTIVLGIPKQQAKEQIDWMYKLMGMVLFSHCARAYAELDKVICKQLKHFSLTYRRHRIRRLFRKVGDYILCRLERCSQMDNLFGDICHMLLILSFDKDYRHLMKVMANLPEIMCYVHFSNRYSPREYFELKKVPMDDIQLFGQVFMAQMHQS
jgi:hypothetical protein